jgi:fucose 4-O-acetylase-like acetyltransferase
MLKTIPRLEALDQFRGFAVLLISLACSGIVFAAFHWFKIRLPVLAAWGKNPLLMYILHLLFLGLMVLPDIPGWYSVAPAWLVIVQIVALIGALSVVGLWLEKKNLILGL